MSQVIRNHEIRRRRARRNKIKKLRGKLAKAKGQSEIQQILTKIQRVSPFYPVNQLTAAAKR